jgi:CheY-like chemotaxis protein
VTRLGGGFRDRQTLSVRQATGTASVTAYDLRTSELRGLILVVDDDAINRLVARVLIEARGYEVIEAEDGESAVSILRDDRGEIGLILMDLDMPGMGGLAATRAIRGVAPQGATVPIVALTRLVDPDSRRLCFDAGMNGFLPKPISATGIESIVCLVGHGAHRAHA